MLKGDIGWMGPAGIRGGDAARRRISAGVRQLESEGVISLKGGATEQYVV